jgi:predicted TPR repeat methyltransferase
VAPPSTPWSGTLITDNATFGRKIAYAPHSPGKALKFGDSLRSLIFYKAAALVDAVLPSGTGLASLLDLHCGSGLFASMLHRHVQVEQTIGVGPSLLKLRAAKRKGIFTEFVEGNGLEILDTIEGTFDLIAALNLFSRTGSLEESLPKITRHLSPRGMIVYSIELGDSVDGKQTAYGHATYTVDDIQQLAKANGLTAIAGEKIVTNIVYANEFRSYVGVLARV